MPAAELPAPLTPIRSGGGTQLLDGPAADTVNENVVSGNDGRVVLFVKNSGGSAYTLTVYMDVTVDGVPSANTLSRVYSIAAGDTRVVGPFPSRVYSTSLRMLASNAALLLRPVRV